MLNYVFKRDSFWRDSHLRHSEMFCWVEDWKIALYWTIPLLKFEKRMGWKIVHFMVLKLHKRVCYLYTVQWKSWIAEITWIPILIFDANTTGSIKWIDWRLLCFIYLLIQQTNSLQLIWEAGSWDHLCKVLLCREFSTLENINSACDFSLDAKGHKDRSQEVSPIVIAEKLASKLETFDGLSGFLVQACNGHLNFMSLSVSEDSVHSFHSKSFQWK